MTTLRRTFLVPADPDAVWAAFAAVDAVHDRLAPGFVTATELDGDVRLVTFANGVTAREHLVSIDGDRRRLAYAITDSPLAMTFHHASFEVLARSSGEHGTARSEVVWTVDLLPAEVAPAMDAMMATGCDAMASALGRLGSPPVAATGS